MSRYRSDDEEYVDAEEEPVRPPPRARRPAAPSQSGYAPSGQARRAPSRAPAPPPRAGLSPNIMMGFMGGLIIGLIGLVLLLVMRPDGGSGTTVGVVPTVPPVNANAPTVPAAAPDDAPRMTIDEFKKLYDSANPPVVIDVRAADAFNQGHIKGAMSVPEAELAAKAAKVPRDKLVVAYCQ